MIISIIDRDHLIDSYDCNLVQSCRRLLNASDVQPTEPSKVEFG